MRVVADANTFLAVALREPERDWLVEIVEGCNLIAPEALPLEVGNALIAMLKRGRLEPTETQLIWDEVNCIPVTLQKVDVRAALEIAVRCDVYAYDACYLECAARNRAPLLTLDKGMGLAARRLAITVLEPPR